MMRSLLKIIAFKILALGVGLFLLGSCDGANAVMDASKETGKKVFFDNTSPEFKWRMLEKYYKIDSAKLVDVKVRHGRLAKTVPELEALVKQLQDDISSQEGVLSKEKSFLETKAETREINGVTYPRKEIEQRALWRVEWLTGARKKLEAEKSRMAEAIASEKYLAEKIPQAEQKLALRAIEIESLKTQIAAARSAEELGKVLPGNHAFESSDADEIATVIGVDLDKMWATQNADYSQHRLYDYAPPATGNQEVINKVNDYFNRSKGTPSP